MRQCGDCPLAARPLPVRSPDLLGDEGGRWRVLRTSNIYTFTDRSPAADRPLLHFVSESPELRSPQNTAMELKPINNPPARPTPHPICLLIPSADDDELQDAIARVVHQPHRGWLDETPSAVSGMASPPAKGTIQMRCSELSSFSDAVLTV